MGGRHFLELQAKEFLELEAILKEYAEKCGKIADILKDKSFNTDGYPTVRRGIFSLRAIIAKQLGASSFDEPDVVVTWNPNIKEPPKRTGKGLKGKAAAEPLPNYKRKKD